MDKFEQNYQLLNDNQRLAVDTLEGPVMVIAGPGTGKTQVLTLRIANLIKSDVAEPENILALTFTNAAAANMRKRLVEMIGVTGYQVRICTFHAFCSTIIGDNGQYFPLNQKSEALSDLATYEIFEEILTKLRLQKLRSTKEKFYYLKDIISSISTLKREGVSEAEFEKIVETQKIEFAQQKDELKKPEIKKWQTNIAKWEDLILIYNEYQQLLQKKNLFDYSDMINFVKDAFIKHEDLLLNYQEQFQYLLVDEYQDTNGAQDNIIDLLTSYWKENANVFVVGDPNQSIYRFQGASLENFLGFVERYPKAQIVGLD
ncbi:MAG: UvrD-helicase domain-containing protein, partial [Pseudomonadales bacterium]|nr:UvrD-helicase domain-containing protein [Pseudomonadales bacterium]